MGTRMDHGKEGILETKAHGRELEFLQRIVGMMRSYMGLWEPQGIMGRREVRKLQGLMGRIRELCDYLGLMRGNGLRECLRLMGEKRNCVQNKRLL